MIETCWFYQCPDPECNCVGITNNVVLEHKCANGLVPCPQCGQPMERIREALPGEYDPQGQEELAKWTTAFKVTFIPPWEANGYLSPQADGLIPLNYCKERPTQCEVNMEIARPASQADSLLPMITRSGLRGPMLLSRRRIDDEHFADKSQLRDGEPFGRGQHSARTVRASCAPSGDSPDSGDILFVPQVARWLRMDEAKVRRLAREKIIRAFKVGKEWRFRRKDIEAWLDGQSGHVPLPAGPVNGYPHSKACKLTPALPADCSPAALRKAIKKMGR